MIRPTDGHILSWLRNGHPQTSSKTFNMQSRLFDRHWLKDENVQLSIIIIIINIFV